MKSHLQKSSVGGGTAETRMQSLSFSQRSCVIFAKLTFVPPHLLIMDEPTDGLDPNQKHEVRKLIDAMRHEKAIIVSTHILEEVEAVCSRAVVIAGGRVIGRGNGVADVGLVGLGHQSKAVTAVLIHDRHQDGHSPGGHPPRQHRRNTEHAWSSAIHTPEKAEIHAAPPVQGSGSSIPRLKRTAPLAEEIEADALHRDDEAI